MRVAFELPFTSEEMAEAQKCPVDGLPKLFCRFVFDRACNPSDGVC